MSILRIVASIVLFALVSGCVVYTTPPVETRRTVIVRPQPEPRYERVYRQPRTVYYPSGTQGRVVIGTTIINTDPDYRPHSTYSDGDWGWRNDGKGYGDGHHHQYNRGERRDHFDWSEEQRLKEAKRQERRAERAKKERREALRRRCHENADNKREHRNCRN